MLYLSILTSGRVQQQQQQQQQEQQPGNFLFFIALSRAVRRPRDQKFVTVTVCALPHTALSMIRRSLCAHHA